VRLVIDREAEASMQVLLHVGLDVLVHGTVDGFLGGDTLGGGTGLGLLLSEELPGALVTLSACLAGEESIVDLGGIDTGEGDAGGCGDGVDLVDALKGDTVDLVGSGDEEEAGVESLEEDDALSTETSGEEDEDAAGFESLTELGDVMHLFAGVTGDLISGIPLCLFDHWS
jgi:hypothetical protein